MAEVMYYIGQIIRQWASLYLTVPSFSGGPNIFETLAQWPWDKNLNGISSDIKYLYQFLLLSLNCPGRVEDTELETGVNVKD